MATGSAGPSKHQGCQCHRCLGFQPDNVLSMKHGATSERRIRHRASVQKRRALRQLGLRQADLEALGRTLLQNWARAAAALSLLDEYAETHGFIDGEGKPHGFATLYVSLLNAERRALKDLHAYFRAAHDDARRSWTVVEMHEAAEREERRAIGAGR
jgi:hypothetical protein